MAVSIPKLQVGDVVEFEYTHSFTYKGDKQEVADTFSGRVLTVETTHGGKRFAIKFEGANLTLYKWEDKWSVHNYIVDADTTKVTKFKKL